MAEDKAKHGRRLSEAESRLLLDSPTRAFAKVRIAERLGCSVGTVERHFAASLVKSRRIGPSGRHLSFTERERISRGLAAGERPTQIARALGRPTSTVTREIERNGGPRRYRALRSHERATLPCPPQTDQALRSPRLREAVETGLGSVGRPADLRQTETPPPLRSGDADQPRDDLPIPLRPGPRRAATPAARNLRTGRTKRKPHGRGPERRGKIAEMVPIAQRPPEIDERRVPGHWEGDLLVGKRNRSFVATLVERHTRYVMLARLGSDRTTEHVTRALKERIAALPRHLVLSLTWDQGNELSAHARFRSETGVDVYFCDPHSPWQRGSNENTNGLLRQYMPKGSDLSLFSQKELDQIAVQLNGRPRETLDWMTPAEKMEELLR